MNPFESVRRNPVIDLDSAPMDGPATRHVRIDYDLDLQVGQGAYGNGRDGFGALIQSV